MKYEPTQVTRELVNKYKDYYSITYREALEMAKKQQTLENKKLLLECVKQANSIDDLKELMIVIVDSI